MGRDDGGMTWRLLGLLSQLIDQPFYAELRTKQQLGYIVGSSITESEGVRGLVFSVQSSAAAARSKRPRSQRPTRPPTTPEAHALARAAL